jgi:hypothetical protein
VGQLPGGASSDKSRGPFNYTRQLSRTLELYERVLVKSDPRVTQNMAAEVYDLVVEVLTDPQELEDFHITKLGNYLVDLPAFRARAGEHRVDMESFRKMLNGYSFAEKLHLVDAAQVRNAPPRPAQRPASAPVRRRRAS